MTKPKKPAAAKTLKRLTIGRIANIAMGAPITTKELLDPDFPVNAVRVAEELVRIAKDAPMGSTWMAHGALTIIALLEHISSSPPSDD